MTCLVYQTIRRPFDYEAFGLLFRQSPLKLFLNISSGRQDMSNPSKIVKQLMASIRSITKSKKELKIDNLACCYNSPSACCLKFYFPFISNETLKIPYLKVHQNQRVPKSKRVQNLIRTEVV